MDSNRNLFWKLTEPEHLRARAFCRKLMGNREDGDDLYQDCLVTALTRFESLRDRASYRPWLYRIMVNTYRNRVRPSRWKRFVTLTEETKNSTAGEDPTDGKTAKRNLERAFRAVSAEDRALVTLFELEGWSIVEIARMRGSSESAIKMRLSRARRKMREALIKFHSKARSGRSADTKTSEDTLCVATKPGLD